MLWGWGGVAGMETKRPGRKLVLRRSELDLVMGMERREWVLERFRAWDKEALMLR